MSDQLRQRLFAELDSIRLIDPHSHIEPKTAASKTLADILGYHYYTELCHSAGMPRSEIEEPGLDPKEKVRRLVARIEPLRNTIQYSWLLELAQRVFRLSRGRASDARELGSALRHGGEENGAARLGAAGPRANEARRGVPDQQFRRPAQRLRHQALYPLPADRRPGVSPGKPEVRQRLEKATNTDVTNAASLRVGDRQTVRALRREGRASLRDLAAAHISPRTMLEVGSRHGIRDVRRQS